VGVAAGEFDMFYLDHYARVVESLRFATGDAAGAEDAAQEAFAKALVKWSTVSRAARPATWVYVVAIRELRRHERRGRRQPKDAPLSRGTTPDHADSIAEADSLARALGALPERQRMAVALRFHGDLTVDEISRVMRCSHGTVKSTLHAALQRLRIDGPGEG
jgi:RNA polymerase sigma-70 factor (ECF subfamily)